MQRASVSRRTENSNNLLSPGQLRSRSSERHSENESDLTTTTSMHNNTFSATTSSNETDAGTSPSNGRIYRSISDPFDRAQSESDELGSTGIASDDDDDDMYFSAASTEQISIGQQQQQNDVGGTDSHIPTLARYPCLESRNKNCWSEPPITIFSVRGHNYGTDHKKVPSDPYLLRSRGSDIFLTDPKKPFTIDSLTNSILGGQLLKQPTLAIIFRFPWGYMNLYFEIPTKLSKFMNDDVSRSNGSAATTMIDSSLSVAEQLFAKWLLGDTNYKNERLKLIPYVAEGPWVVRNMVTGRPAIIGKKLPVTYQLTRPSSTSTSPLLIATLDIGNSSATAKRIVSVCRRYMSALTVDIGFVIQGDCAAELPEQMLGAMRIHGPDPLKAPKLN